MTNNLTIFYFFRFLFFKYGLRFCCLIGLRHHEESRNFLEVLNFYLFLNKTTNLKDRFHLKKVFMFARKS